TAQWDLTRFSNAELEAIRDEAEAAGKPVAVHAYGPDAVKDAVRAGARSIEHVAYFDDESIQAMLDTKAWLVPTVGMQLTVFESPGDPEAWREFVGHQATSSEHPRARAERALQELGRAYEAGVKIAMGTDYGNNAGENLYELVAMREAGMS